MLAIYLPPSSIANLFLEELSNALSEFSPTGHLCFAGEFNLNIMDSSRHIVCDHLNLLETHGIQSVIEALTREAFLGGKFVSSFIDHINLRIFDNTVKAAVILRKTIRYYFIASQVTSNKGEDSNATKTKVTITDQVQFDKKVNDYDNNHLTSVEAAMLYDTVVKLLVQFAAVKTELWLKGVRKTINGLRPKFGGYKV